MDLKLGEPLNEKVLKRDLQKIFNLNYFTKLDPEFIGSQKPGYYKIRLNVEEKRTGSLNVGGGYGQRSGLFFYSDIYFDNLFGTGQLLALKGQFGENQTSYQVKYFNPWMWDDSLFC